MDVKVQPPNYFVWLIVLNALGEADDNILRGIVVVAEILYELH